MFKKEKLPKAYESHNAAPPKMCTSDRIFPKRHSESLEKANSRVLFVIFLFDCWWGHEGSDGD